MPLFLLTMKVQTMKKIYFIFLSSFISIPAFADASYCYSITNQDQKNYCLAQAKRDSSYCYSIYNDQAKKNMCLAVVKNDSSYCYSIYNNQNMKNSCLGQVGN